MQKKEIKKIIISLAAIAMLLVTALTSFATNVTTDINALRQNGNVTIQNGNSVSENIVDKTKNNTTNKVNVLNLTTNNIGNDKVNNTTNNTVNNAVNNTQGLPDTGAEYSGVIALGVCITIAVYSYIKVKKYNV